MNERLPISESSPLKVRFFDYAHFSYPLHFHSEYEIIYIKEGTGTRFLGNNIAQYKAGDILLIGSNLPHFMKSDDAYHSGNTDLRVKGTIIQFEKDFMYYAINHYPHFIKIKKLLQDSMRGIYFSSAKLEDLLAKLPLENGLNQLMLFLELLKEMSETDNRQIISTREIERFRNNLSWKYRLNQYINEAQTIFESRYELFVFAPRGIAKISIYAPRNQELAELSGIPLGVTLMLEFRDAITPRLQSLLGFLGTGIVFVLTQVIGRGLGLVGRGILQGIGSVSLTEKGQRKNRE
ncbi:MAG: hypothetical protein RLZZ184_3108 [Cyanobacteriota bacterium]